MDKENRKPVRVESHAIQKRIRTLLQLYLQACGHALSLAEFFNSVDTHTLALN